MLGPMCAQLKIAWALFGHSHLFVSEVGAVSAIFQICFSFQSFFMHLFHVVSPEPPELKGEAHMTQTAVQGSSTLLDCPVQGDPSPVLRWLRDGKPLLRNLRLQTLHNGSLAIYSITVNIHLSFPFLSSLKLFTRVPCIYVRYID